MPQIFDNIDKHYRFTDEDLDFVFNYDFKYRMGADAESDEE